MYNMTNWICVGVKRFQSIKYEWYNVNKYNANYIQIMSSITSLSKPQSDDMFPWKTYYIPRKMMCINVRYLRPHKQILCFWLQFSVKSDATMRFFSPFLYPSCVGFL